MLSVRVVLAAASLVLGVPAVARAAPPSPAPDPGTAGFDRDVTQLATNGHRTYVAGLFSQAFAPTAGDNLVSADSGRLLATWPDSFGLVAAVPDGGGGWFAAGGATVRHLLPGGVVDAGFSAPTTDVDIKALALSPDGATLWITGKFGSVGGQPRAGVAALRASDGTLLAWTPGASGAGWGIAATADTVYVAGYTHSGDGDGYSLAAFDAHTGALREVAMPRRPGDQGTGVVLAPGGQTVYASFNASGQGSTGAFDAATLAPRWTLQTGLPPAAIALAAGRVYLTGVGSVGGQSRDGAISVGAATGEPTGWFVPGMERGIAVAPDGAEAYFSRGQLSGWPWRGGIAASTADGALLPWNPSGTEWYAADSPAMSPDGQSLLVAGYESDARIRAGAAMLDETGTVTPWVDPVSQADRGPRVSSAAMDAGGTTYTTQMPDWAGDAGPRSVEAVNADGALRFRLALDGEATATLSPDQQTLYVVGTFTSIGGVARPGLAAVRTADGSLADWPLTVAGGAVSHVAFSPDGATMYLAGSFTSVDGVPRTRVAAVDARTGGVLPFDPAPDAVPGLAVSPDGTVVYLYGPFTTVAGRSQSQLAGVRVADGALVFAPTVKAGVIAAVALPDGQTVVAATGSPTRPLDSWDAATGQELSFGDNVRGGSVDALALEPDGAALEVVGESFSVDGVYHKYARFAIARGGTPADVTPPRIAGDAGTSQWVECDPGTWDSHPAAYAYAWTLDGAPVAGATTRELLLQADDEGRALRCAVSAGTATATSAPVTVAASDPFMLPAPRRTPEAAAPAATASPTPTPTPPATSTPTATPASSAVSATTAAVASPRADGTAPRVTLRRRGRTARVRVSEAATARITLRRCRGRTCRTLTRRLALTTRERVLARRLAKGRYTLTVRATDAHGNTATKVLRFRL